MSIKCLFKFESRWFFSRKCIWKYPLSMQVILFRLWCANACHVSAHMGWASYITAHLKGCIFSWTYVRIWLPVEFRQCTGICAIYPVKYEQSFLLIMILILLDSSNMSTRILQGCVIGPNRVIHRGPMTSVILIIIGSHNGVRPVRCHPIFWTHVTLLITKPLAKIHQHLIKMQQFSQK